MFFWSNQTSLILQLNLCVSIYIYVCIHLYMFLYVCVSLIWRLATGVLKRLINEASFKFKNRSTGVIP